MPTQLFPDKYRIRPARPGSVPRPRLTVRLDAALQSKLTLVSAPAGFGKTTLLSVFGCFVAWQRGKTCLFCT